MSSAQAAAAEVEALVAASRDLSARVDGLRFAAPVAYVYNPLAYAAGLHEAYLRRYGQGCKEVLLLGMNPGPFGMAQSGVPFGDVTMVRDWLRLSGEVARPAKEHPKRPVRGLSCSRAEVSGQRLWGWARDRFRTPERFFSRFFVVNYCPLVFMEESGRNLTPDKLPAAARQSLFAACDDALCAVIACLRPRLVIGVGAFAAARAEAVVEERALGGIGVGTILHPSPASPTANRGWAQFAEAQLGALGVALPDSHSDSHTVTD
jgi:single-strand selective monofunctional uracil DNA glycosylase